MHLVSKNTVADLPPAGSPETVNAYEEVKNPEVAYGICVTDTEFEISRRPLVTVQFVKGGLMEGISRREAYSKLVEGGLGEG